MEQIRDKNGRILGGRPPNGFDKRPQDRGRGFWKREASPRWKLEQMMKLTDDELRKVAGNKKAPLFERKLAIAINKGEWREIESMINQVYGQPKQTIEYAEPIPIVDLRNDSKKTKKINRPNGTIRNNNSVGKDKQPPKKN